MKVWDINVGLSGNKMDIWKSVDNLTDKINDITLQRNFAEKKAKEYEELQQENKELKKQLKEYQLQKMAFPNELIKDKTFYDLYNMPTYEELLVQQKEFIKYLEDEKDRLARECSNIYEDSLGHTRLVNADKFDEVNDILQKYRSIIGDEK